MDRKAWIAIILSILGLFAWQWYVSKYYPPAQKAAGVSPAPLPTSSPSPATGTSTTPAPPSAQPAMVPRAESLEAEGAEFLFHNDSGGIEQVLLLGHRGENGERVSLNRDRAIPIGALGFEPGEVAAGFEMRVDQASREAIFSKKEANGLEITKNFTLPSQKHQRYVVKFQLSFRNTGTENIDVPAFYVSTGGAAPIHLTDLPTYTRFTWAYDGKTTNIDVNWFSPSSIPLLGIPIRAARPLYLESKPKVEWAAVSSQYFCTIVTLKDGVGSSVWAKRFDTQRQNNTSVFGIQGALGMEGFTLPPGAVVTKTFEIYAGPKELSRLRKLGGSQDKIMNFGMFGWVSEFLLWAMNSLHGLLGNYAAAIIVLTLIIKFTLWPIQNKATNEMRRMSALSPKMTEIRERYKDDPQKMNEEVMKLYREYGVNPFSGCLPMLIQIPIFFGFYAMLGTAIELRNSSFLWVHDLSQPDTVAHMLGFPINVLPLFMATTMVWQMLITPRSGDAMQQRILYLMPIVFLVFCYNYASALALYWTTQNIFSIVQLYLTRNRPLPKLEKKSAVTKREITSKKKKKNRNIP